MSSSDPAAEPGAAAAARFLAGMALAAALCTLGLLVLTALVDPTGLVRARWPDAPYPCTAGIRGDERLAKPFLAAIHRPSEILLGTSRVGLGMAAADFAGGPQGPAVNLALPAASLEEVADLLETAMAVAPLRRVWLGVNFGMLFDGPPRHAAAAAGDPAAAIGDPADAGGAVAAVRHGILAGEAIRESVRTLLRPDRCRTAPLTPLGFRTPTSPQPASAGAQADRFAAGSDPQQFAAARRELLADFRRRAALDPALLAPLYAERLRRLSGLLAAATRRGIRVVLFIAPSHPAYFAALTEAGLDGAYRRWRDDVAAIAAAPGREGNLVFLDLGAPAFAGQGDDPSCSAAGRGDCPFYDPTHFRPWVGRSIRDRAVEAGPNPPAPRRRGRTCAWRPPATPGAAARRCRRRR